MRVHTGVHAVVMTEDVFDSWLIAHHYTFVNYYAPWCVWCQRLEPVWEALAEKVEIEGLPVSVVKVDCVANQNLCMAQRIQVSLPLIRSYFLSCHLLLCSVLLCCLLYDIFSPFLFIIYLCSVVYYIFKHYNFPSYHILSPYI